MIPVRNVMEEMCPSPVARKLRMNRSAPGGRSGLVRVRNDGGIEQGSGFQGVFGQEIGADQQPSLFGQVLLRRSADSRTCSKRSRKSLWICWCRWENSAETSVQEGADSVFRERHDPGDDPGDPLGTPRTEGPEKNARLVGIEDRGGAFEVNGHGGWRLLRDGDRFFKTRQYVLRQSHLRQRKQEGQGGFRSLVPVDPIHMQPIAAAACLGRVEFQSEIVPADEPVEGALRLFVPPDVRCGAIGFQTGRDRGLRLNGLLVEIGARAAAAVEPIAANGPKVTLLGHLQFRQPAQGLAGPARSTACCPVACPLRIKACASFALSYDSSSSNQCQSGCALASKSSMSRQVSVSRVWLTRLSPLNRRRYSWMPIRPNAHARGEVNSVSAGNASAKSCPAIIWKLRKGERPTPMPSAQSALPVTVLRSLFVQPAPVKTQVVVEAFRFEIESVMEERRGGGGQCPHATPDPRPIHRAAPPG